ncbi:hypothetical protein O181_018406 [Austropuccinia psidii MF-1]|uniref:Uncharacterized protein n=1 Tax=Austropuccinia psidii MF-1 TaxID=1389203 RepID=A0A9Q3GSX7_9BASI|nr:hypothetical protein [Austropuccinia psidii MF-1]
MPCEQNTWQPTPGPSGIQWSEGLFWSNWKAINFPILTFQVGELTLPCILELSQANEPPICTLTSSAPGLSEVPDSKEPPVETNSNFQPGP